MSLPAVLTPLLVQVLLTFLVLLYLGVVRGRAMKAGAMRVDDFSLRSHRAPPEAGKVADNFQNQFELPVLFYVLTILAIVTRTADLLFVVLAWIYVLARIVHALVHCTSNVVRLRSGVFAISALVLMVMWAAFALRLYFGPLFMSP